MENVEVAVGDGTRGLPNTPIRRDPRLRGLHLRPTAPREQLAQGGRLVQPMGRGGEEEVVLFEKREELVRRRTVTGAHFVRLYGAHAFPDR